MQEEQSKDSTQEESTIQDKIASIDPLWYGELFKDMGLEYEENCFTKNTAKEVEFLVQNVLPSKELNILDVGCGTARHTLSLARMGYSNITGIDLSESFINIAKGIAEKEGLPPRYMVCDARNLPFENEFDVAFCLCEGAFCLLENDDENYKIIKAIHKSLKPGGTFVLTALHLLREGPFDPMTCKQYMEMEISDSTGKNKILKCADRSFTFPELKFVLTQLGFQVIKGSRPFSQETIQVGDMELMIISKKV